VKFCSANHIPGKPGKGERNGQQNDKRQAPEFILPFAKLLKARADTVIGSRGGSNLPVTAIPLFSIHLRNKPATKRLTGSKSV
jgi:hypothetical protein